MGNSENNVKTFRRDGKIVIEIPEEMVITKLLEHFSSQQVELEILDRDEFFENFVESFMWSADIPFLSSRENKTINSFQILGHRFKRT